MPALGDIWKYPAMWLWLVSFLLLSMAITSSEQRKTGTSVGILEDRWKLAVVLSCVVLVAGLAARAAIFPGPAIVRTASSVEGIEIQRTGVPPHQHPLLEDGYLRQSKYKFIVFDGRTHESTPGGGWIARPSASPMRYVVREVVESHQVRPEGPGAVLRSTISVYDGSELIGRKTFHEGMVEDGHGWLGAIALKFVQTVLQPAPSPASGVVQRIELLAHPLYLPDAKMKVTERSLVGCPASVALNPRDWRELRTTRWSFQALMNIREVACGENSVILVMGGKSGIYVDVISSDGLVVFQGRASAGHPIDLYAIEEVRASSSGWRVRLVGRRPGPSVNVPTVPIERFELAVEPNK